MNKELKYSVTGFTAAIIFTVIIKSVFFINEAYFDHESIIAGNTIKEPFKPIFFHINTRGKELFKENCSPCHSMMTTAIDYAMLATVTQRVPDCETLYEFIRNSQKVIKSGDPYFMQMYERFNRTGMPPFPDLSDNDIDNILEYVEQVHDPNLY